jgi:hypothetical protein
VSRKPSKKPTPKPSPTVFVATKHQAAIGQFESAILLWLNEADPISILVLASNAEECYHALGKKVGKPSFHQEFMAKMPHSFRDRMRYIQDFAKHGFMDLDERTPFETSVAEGLMLVALDCHAQIFGNVTPLMKLYWLRMLTERPRWTSPPKLPVALQQIVIDSGAIEEVGRGTRKECFERYQDFLEGIPLAGLSRFKPPPQPWQ